MAADQGPVFRAAVKKILARVNIEIVKRSDQAKGFVVLPKKRWVVGKNLRMARTMQTIGKGLGKSQSKGARLPAPRVNKAHVEKAMQSRVISPDKLLQGGGRLCRIGYSRRIFVTVQRFNGTLSVCVI